MTVDEELSQTISQVTNSLFSCIGALAAIAASTKGTFLALIVPLIFVYNYVQTFFRKTNTTVARMESISRSPIYADFSQALTGLVSIRAYHEEDRFVHHLEGILIHSYLLIAAASHDGGCPWTIYITTNNSFVAL